MLQDEFELAGEVKKGPCRFCGDLNLPDEGNGLGPFDCCDPRPVKVMPIWCLVGAALKRRQATLAELAAERESFDARWRE